MNVKCFVLPYADSFNSYPEQVIFSSSDDGQRVTVAFGDDRRELTFYVSDLEKVVRVIKDK